MVKYGKALAITAVALLLVALISVTGLILKGNAQSNNSTMRSLFETLNERMANESGFFVAVTFANPLSPEDEAVWSLPDRRENATDEISRHIAEVNDDNICFDILAGAARYIECTPFSNIVSVRYLVD